MKAGLLAGVGLAFSPHFQEQFAFGAPKSLRMAFLHLAPIPGDLEGNRALVESAITYAAREGADWIITPELCVCGYSFTDIIGTDWIRPQPGRWMQGICRSAARLGVTLFLSHPERDPETNKLYNSVFVIGPDGFVCGRHRKLRTLKTGAEAWSSPGEKVVPITAPPLEKVGVLICADVYGSEIAGKMKDQGAEILVSSAAWNPGLHGPSGEWERRSLETGLPLVVCNRTGKDLVLDFRNAESVVAWRGQRLHTFKSEQSAIFFLDWASHKETPFTLPKRFKVL